MHIPDNYLSLSTCAVMGAAMAPVWAASAKKIKSEITKEEMPRLGIGAAFSFLVMMINVPLPGGTTGHAVGGTLLAVLIGPYAACISITATLLIQALFFGDGGILSFGANAFNMAFILPFTGYFFYKFIKDRAKTEKGGYFAAIAGSYIGINAAALMAATEFGVQPLLFRSARGRPLYCPYPLSVSIPAMVIPHLLLLGAVEAFFTAAAYSYVKKVSPGMIYAGGKQKIKAVYGLLAALILLSPLGLLAAGTAWGEWDGAEIKSMLGYIPEGIGKGFSLKAMMPDYSVPGLSGAAGYILSAAAGAAILVIIFKLLGLILKKNAVKADD